MERPGEYQKELERQLSEHFDTGLHPRLQYMCFVPRKVKKRETLYSFSWYKACTCTVKKGSNCRVTGLLALSEF